MFLTMYQRSSAVVVSAFVFCFMVATRPDASAAERTATCDPRFGDVASRTLLSDVVFHGRVTQLTSSHGQVDEGGSRRPNTTLGDVVELHVVRTLKGRVTAQTVTVVADCSLDVKVRVHYIVFAVNGSRSQSDLDGTRQSLGVVGRPLPYSRHIVRQVNESACAECEGQWEFLVRGEGGFISASFRQRRRLYNATMIRLQINSMTVSVSVCLSLCLSCNAVGDCVLAGYRHN